MGGINRLVEYKSGDRLSMGMVKCTTRKCDRYENGLRKDILGMCLKSLIFRVTKIHFSDFTLKLSGIDEFGNYAKFTG